ncbi:DNA polymerase sliding clamp [Halovenus salina]|uniref:DNA polymerase sliding clamp n=1 Tax=Halovenus salina TaxID=1510225 RepID=A0ABD5W3Y2_9EURY|nr:DNA polymerase sliding clamp [Halovenus salina]
MFSATIDATAFRNALASVEVLVEECRIHVDSDGMRLRAADPALVALVDLTLDAEQFEQYEASEAVLGVNLERLSEILSVAETGDTVRMEFDERSRKLDVEVGTLSYTLGLLDPDSIRDEPDLPDLEPPAEVTLDGRHIDRGVKAAEMVSDHLRLAVDPDRETLVIAAEGDTDEVLVELGRQEVAALSPGPADSLYSLDYLTAINRVIPRGQTVTLELGEEFLAGFEFVVPEADQPVTYRVAPRLQRA